MLQSRPAIPNRKHWQHVFTLSHASLLSVTLIKVTCRTYFTRLLRQPNEKAPHKNTTEHLLENYNF